MAGKNTAVFGIYKSAAQAELAVDRIIAGGFSSNDISVLLPDNQSTEGVCSREEHQGPGRHHHGRGNGRRNWRCDSGFWLESARWPFPASDLLSRPVPIMGALAGLGAGGAVGGLIGALVGMGMPEYEAKRYEGRVKAGGVLLSVHCDTSDEISRAKDLLKATGAEDIASSGEKSVSTHGVEPVGSRR